MEWTLNDSDFPILSTLIFGSDRGVHTLQLTLIRMDVILLFKCMAGKRPITV